MPMSNDIDIEKEIKETAQEAAKMDEPFVPSIKCTDIDEVDEFGDFEYYAWERYYTQRKSQSTVGGFYNSVNKLEEFIEQSESVDCNPEDISESEAKKFLRWITNSVRETTAKKYINELDNMAGYYVSIGYYPGNPFDGLADHIGTSSSNNKSRSFQDNERLTVDDSRLREAIRSTHGSPRIVLLSILVKTGIRISEALNLDWEDITIDNNLADGLIPEPRFELSNDTDMIYIDSDKTEETYNEIHTHGNKRKVDTRIPIDAELKRLLLWHALTRERRFDDQNPVFMSNTSARIKSSNRLSTKTAWRRITKVAEEYGWHDTSRSELRNMTPHWFRAKFGSYMENRLTAANESDKSDFSANPRHVIKGLRGDISDDVAEGYHLREDDHYKYIRPLQFKIGLEEI